MDWRIKAVIRRTLLALPGGANLYRGLTAGLLGTNAGMAYKWFRVFPAHIRVLRAHFGAQARAQRLWCFDCGVTPAAGLAMAIASDERGLLTDRSKKMLNRYLPVARQVLQEMGEGLAVQSSAPESRIADLLKATASGSIHQALENISMHYFTEHSAADTPAWQGTIGCIFSAGTLEHYSPEALEVEITRQYRALSANGVLSHVVDHRDHRWHADKRLSPHAHLQLDDATYQRQFGNPLDYHNRWLRSRYLELFTRLGFQVTCHDIASYTTELPPYDPATFAADYRHAEKEDLQALVTHFVAVKK